MATQFKEQGTSGLAVWNGLIDEAYSTKLEWPTCYPEFNRIRRGDPEIAIVRRAFSVLAGDAGIDFEVGDNPTADELAFQDFGRQVLDDLDGGPGEFLDNLVSYAPFYGWAYFSVVPGLRRRDWRPPDRLDKWRSQYDDGLIGLRRIAYRSHSSFDKWEIDEETGRLMGMWQYDPPNQRELLSLENSLHVTFGDPHNPEGLAMLEAIWRLERIKYQLEIVQGIGYEHAAGYLNVEAENALTGADKIEIQKAARAILTAQEGNYAAWPKGVKGEVKDIPFTAAPSILEAIRFYSILKLQTFLMQWVTMATTSGAGAYSAVDSGAEMGIMAFNSMMAGFGRQIDTQIGRRLYEWNKDKFPGIERRPRLVITPAEKAIPLDQLAAFVSQIASVIPLDDDDILAIRRKSGFLPESLPDSDAQEPEPEPAGNDAAEDGAAEDVQETADGDGDAEMAFRPFTVSNDEYPYRAPAALDYTVTPEDVDGATRRFLKWADDNDPLLAGLLRAKIAADEGEA